MPKRNNLEGMIWGSHNLVERNVSHNFEIHKVPRRTAADSETGFGFFSGLQSIFHQLHSDFHSKERKFPSSLVELS